MIIFIVRGHSRYLLCLDNYHCIVILVLIGCCLATEEKQNQRVSLRRKEENDLGTRLVCEYPQSAGKVTLSPADKEQLTRNSFETFSSCEILKLDHLGIVDMENGVFSNMGRLYELHIDGDNIDIRQGLFEGLESLASLSLTNMSIISLLLSHQSVCYYISYMGF